MSNYLIDDRPIMFLPQLAKALGSCERAIVLQQIHWLCNQPNSGVVYEDERWVYGSYEEWCREYFTMWSHHTLAKIIRGLEASGVLISAQLRAREHDRTKYYRVNYDTLNAIVPDQVASNAPDEVASKRPRPVRSNPPDQAASINRTKTPTESTAKGKRPPSGRNGGKYSDDPPTDKPRKYSVP